MPHGLHRSQKSESYTLAVINIFAVSYEIYIYVYNCHTIIRAFIV